MYQRVPTNWDAIPLFMDTKLAARILGVSVRTVQNYVKNGMLKAIYPTPGGKVIKITKEALMEFGGAR